MLTTRGLRLEKPCAYGEAMSLVGWFAGAVVGARRADGAADIKLFGTAQGRRKGRGQA
jgi:hypothetical protein